MRSGFTHTIAIACLAGCGRTPHQPTTALPALAASPAPTAPVTPDPDLHREPPKKLLAIDWTKVSLTSDRDALALWAQIAPTGIDWEQKLAEVPPAIAKPLAVALLHEGNFLCTKQPTGDCAKPVYDVDPPADTATLADPCLRRVLALWALDQIEDDELPKVREALKAIAAIPLPESQLVAAAIQTVPEADQDGRLELLSIAYRAGQHELANGRVGSLDEAHLITAVQKHHIDGALEVLSAEGHRAVYLAAVTDETLAPKARAMAITDLAAADDKLAPDLRAALVTAAKSKDCLVAATAARVLDQHADHRFVPKRPRTTNIATLMHGMCVLASYENLQRSDEASLLPSWVPARGLERVTFTIDPLSETDPTTQAAELVKRDDAVLPEIEDLVHAMAHCTGTVCVSEDREYRFVWKPDPGGLALFGLEVADRPPCQSKP